MFTLAGLDDAGRDAYIHAYPAQHPEHFDAAGLIRQLQAAPAMRPLAANPLLLTILCFVVDDPGGVRLPATRAQLYDQAVNKLLGLRPRRMDVPYPGTEPDAAEKRALLEEAALSLFGWGSAG